MSLRPLARRLASLAIVLLAADPAGAQVVRVPDEPSCANCSITARVTATLVQPEEHYARPMRVTADARNRFWVIREAAVPLLFDPNGRFVQSLGQKGAGPDEYAWVDQVYFAGDSTIVNDLGNGRTAVLGPALKVSRYIPGREQIGSPVVVEWPRQVLASVSGYSRDTAPPIKVISFAGERMETIRSIGSTLLPFARVAERCAGHRLTRPAAGSFWAAAPSCAYDLYEYGLDGIPRRVLERRPAWYDRTASVMGHGGPSRAPEASIAGIDRDESGLVWVYLYRPLPGWRDGWARVPPGAGEVSVSQIDYDKIVGLRIEVIDPAAGRVVARQDLDGFVRSVLPGQRAAFVEVSPTGDERIVIREYRLVRR